ncbi:MAG: hypothetical protein JWN14_3747, partial [Chthonomonadales bacterium]|nr:hypothetical protein [Chthonomonadales bacterium]
MMNVMRANVAAKPLQQLRQAKIGRFTREVSSS